MLDEPVLADDGGPLWDVVLAGDVCYEQPMAERMTAWLPRHAAAGALVLMGDPVRTYRPADGLARLTESLVPSPLAPYDSDLRRPVVWRAPPSPTALLSAPASP